MFRIFFVILFIPAVAAIVISASSANLENRAVATFPEFPQKFDEVGKYFPNIDTYVRDQLGFRTQAISAFRKISNFINNDNSPLVVAGKDNWLYYTGVDTFSRTTGNDFSQARVDLILTRAKEAYQFSQQVGADFIVLPVPSKDDIYSEYLPNWAQQLIAKKLPTEHDAIVQSLEQNNIPYVDVDTILGERKTPTTPVYYKSDTHWNDYGAYVIFYESISRVDPNTNLPTPDQFLNKFESGKFFGILDQFLGNSDTLPQLLPQFNEDKLVRRPEKSSSVIADHESMNSYEVDYGVDFPRVLVIGDSFTYTFFRKFMGSYAGKYHWTHNHYGEYDRTLFTSFKPDIVIFEFVDFQVPVWH